MQKPVVVCIPKIKTHFVFNKSDMVVFALLENAARPIWTRLLRPALSVSQAHIADGRAACACLCRGTNCKNPQPLPW